MHKESFEHTLLGMVHRVDGPASYDARHKIERWCFAGELHRVDGPAVIHYNEDGSVSCEQWFNHGKRERIDGPAVVFDDGGEQWYMKGRLHRENGPAITRPHGDMQFYLFGNRYGIVDYVEASGMNNSEKMYFMLKYGEQDGH